MWLHDVKRGWRGQEDLIRCRGHVVGLFRPWKGRITVDHGRGATRPAGERPVARSPLCFRDRTRKASCRSRSSTLPENRRENTILFQTLVRRAVMMIRPTTWSRSISASIGAQALGQYFRSWSQERSWRAGWSYDFHHWFSWCSLACCLASMTRLSIIRFIQTSGVSTTRGVLRVRHMWFQEYEVMWILIWVYIMDSLLWRDHTWMHRVSARYQGSKWVTAPVPGTGPVSVGALLSRQGLRLSRSAAQRSAAAQQWGLTLAALLRINVAPVQAISMLPASSAIPQLLQMVRPEAIILNFFPRF